jgi:hypothetical protein
MTNVSGAMGESLVSLELMVRKNLHVSRTEPDQTATLTRENCRET